MANNRSSTKGPFSSNPSHYPSGRVVEKGSPITTTEQPKVGNGPQIRTHTLNRTLGTENPSHGSRMKAIREDGILMQEEKEQIAAKIIQRSFKAVLHARKTNPSNPFFAQPIQVRSANAS